MTDSDETGGPTPPAFNSALAAWCDWYVLSGVTDAVEDRSAAPRAMAAPAHAPTAAASCGTLAELEHHLGSHDICGLGATATRLCFADGDPRAEVMLIGEAPGAEEDRQGRPFVGASGRLLDKMLGSIGLDRGRVYITNAVYWRPPGNRSPSSDEIAACLPFLERQIELVAPRVLISVGGVAAKLLLGVTEGVTRLRGRRLEYRPASAAAIPMLVLFHPAYLLRQPLQKRLAWRDLLMLREMLGGEGRTLH